MGSVQSQDLASHQWKDRVILLFTDDLEDQTYQNQIIELQNCKSGLKDRKLVVYHITPTAYKKGLSSTNWIDTAQKFYSYKKTNSAFEFVLIGLDGGKKVQQSEFMSCKKLFSTIDVMPMRRSEIKHRDR